MTWQKKNGVTKGRGRVSRACLLMLAAMASELSSAADEDLYFSDLPVVATVSRLPQALADAPGSVTVIDREMIRASGARQVSDLLKLVPGFFVTPHNQESSRVVYHGLSNENNSPRVQVLVDGRSQYSPVFKSGVNWDLLPVAMENIERIEVIRGSNSAAYGSNAFLGVINIITVDPAQVRGTTISANHGNQSIRDEMVRWGGRIGNADVRFTYQQQGDGGLRKMENSGVWIDPHDSRHANVLDLRANVPLTDHDEFQFSLSQASTISQFGRPNDIADPFRDFSQSSTSINLGWRRAISADEEVNLRFSRVEDWGSESYAMVGSFRYDFDRGGKSDTNELELQHSFSPWQSTRLVWGAGLRDETLRSISQFFTASPFQRETGRLFGNLEWRPSQKWLFNAGANWEHSTWSGTIFDPRLSASYHFVPGHTLRLVAGRSHRMPSFFEQRGDLREPTAGNPPYDRVFLAASGVEPERVDTLEASYLGEFKRLRASLDVRVFREKIPNRLQWVPYPLSQANQDGTDRQAPYFPYGRADTFLNNENVKIHGYEYQWRWQPFDATRLMYSHAFISIDADLVDESVLAEEPPNSSINPLVGKISQHTRDSAPRHSSSAMLIQQLPLGLELSVMYFKQGFMQWTRNTSIKPYEQVDWRLAYPFKVGPTRGEVAYTAQSANGSHEGLRPSRIVNETHWLTLRLDL